MSKIATNEENALMGSRLADVRARTRLSQGQFAERIDVSPRAYQNYERGEREAPASVMRRVSETYGVSLSWLLGADRQERSDHAAVDTQLLERLLAEVDARLTKSGRQLSVEKRSQVVALLYAHFCDKESMDAKYLDQMLAVTA